MDIKVQRDTKLVIALTEEEAAQLRTLCALTPRGSLPIADELYDAIADADIRGDGELLDKLFADIRSPLA